MKAFVFHSSADLMEWISMDQNPIHVINTVKSNHMMVCREINARRFYEPQLYKTKRFSVFS